MVIPGLVVVIDDSSSEASSWVDTGSGDRNCRQVDHEHRKSDGKRCQNLYQFTKQIIIIYLLQFTFMDE